MSKWRIYFFLYFVLTFSFFFYLFRNHDLFASIEKIGVERGETNTWVRKLSLIIIIIFLIILSFNFNLIQISFFFFFKFFSFFFFSLIYYVGRDEMVGYPRLNFSVI